MTMKKLALLLAVGTLAGCGIAPQSNLALTNPSALTSQSTEGLQAGWTSIHKAIFDHIDVLHQGFIDENEAGPYISLSDFQKADLNHDGKIDFNEFMMYATQGGFLQGNDTEQGFVNRLRGQLGGIFNDLDANHDGWLSQSELSTAALTKEGLAFYYPNLHISVKLTTVTPAEFQGADHLKTGLLSQSEFEDLYVQMVCDALDPPAPAPDPAPSAAPSASPAKTGTTPQSSSYIY